MSWLTQSNLEIWSLGSLRQVNGFLDLELPILYSSNLQSLDRLP